MVLMDEDQKAEVKVSLWKQLGDISFFATRVGPLHVVDALPQPDVTVVQRVGMARWSH